MGIRFKLWVDENTQPEKSVTHLMIWCKTYDETIKGITTLVEDGRYPFILDVEKKLSKDVQDYIEKNNINCELLEH